MALGKSASASRVSCSVASTTMLIVVFLVSACVPLQWGPNQVPDVNTNITEFKDDSAAAAGMPSAVDVLMADFLAAAGDFESKKPVPGCAVGIMEDNELSRLKGYGLADVQADRPFTHFTPSVVGSVSKTWTALAALRLVELGLLDLNDTVADHLPSAPADWQGFTIRELLSHQTGLAYMPTFNAALDTEVELGMYWFGNNAVVTKLGILPKLVWPSYVPTPVVNLSAGQAQYSNTGYMLLGSIVELIAGANPDVVGNDFTTYEALVWRQVGMFAGNISDADQMTSPALNEYWRQSDIPNFARGYKYNDGSMEFDPVAFGNSSLLMIGPAGWEGPAGGWTMTIGDLVRLMVAIQNNLIVSQDTRDNLMLPVLASDGNGNWGLGVNRVTKLGRSTYMHDGKYPGYKARYMVFPNEDFGVAIMCNEDGADIKLPVDRIAGIFLNDSAPPAGAAGFAPAAVLDGPFPSVNEDDPDYVTTEASDEPVFEVAPQEKARLAQDLDRQEQAQLVLAKRRERLEEDSRKQGCESTFEALVDRYDLSILSPIAQCAESPENFQPCIANESRALVRDGLIDKRTRRQIVSCAAKIDRNDLRRLTEGG